MCFQAGGRDPNASSQIFILYESICKMDFVNENRSEVVGSR